MINKLNLRLYGILSLVNFGLLYYLVMDKSLFCLAVFPLFLINQAALCYLIDDLVKSVNDKIDKARFSFLLIIKFGSLGVIVYFMKQYQDAILAMGVAFLIQTILLVSR